MIVLLVTEDCLDKAEGLWLTLLCGGVNVFGRFEYWSDAEL